ncbi:MAG: Na+/H+ antiporter NhaC family protein [Bilophila wadsworthia]
MTGTSPGPSARRAWPCSRRDPLGFPPAHCRGHRVRRVLRRQDVPGFRHHQPRLGHHRTNIFLHIGSMLYTTVPATFVALGLYWYLGLNHSGGAMPDLTPITDALSANFNRSFLLALPPIVLVALAIRGIPPLPTLVIAILVGVVCAFVIQDGMTVKGMFKAATDGYVSQTGHPLVDKILSRGGLTSMSFVVFLLLIAMTLGGILEGTGALGVVVDRMTRSVTSPGGLILATLVSCYLMTIGTGNGMLSIIVPARAFEKKFRDMGIQSRVLSRTLEDAVTLGIALVPYSMAAFFIVGVLKIDAMQYPYAFVNWIVPIFSSPTSPGSPSGRSTDAGNSPAESEA